MADLNIVISHCLIIELHELHRVPAGTQIQKGIEKILTYKNPKFHEALKWGYSTWNIDSHLYSYKYSENNHSMYISRGAQKKVEAYLKTFNIGIKYIDQTIVLPRVPFDHSKTVLREDQQDAVQAMVSAPDNMGILIAFTSFGKSLTMLELMRRLGQPTVVVLHTTFLQEQWLKEATNPDTFNMSPSLIGGVGGIFKKRKRGLLNLCLYHSLCKDEHLQFFRLYAGLIVSDEVQKSPIDDIQKVVNMFPARYKFGCSARIERKDQKEFLTLDTFGDICHVAVEKDGDSKILSKITIVPTGYVDIIPDAEDPDDLTTKELEGYTGMLSRMASDKERNTTICKIVISKIRQGKLVIIFVERKEQAGCLMKMLSNFKGDMLIGPTASDAVNEMVCPRSVKDILLSFDHEGAYERITKLAERKELQFIIGTQKAEVGLSIRTIDVGLVTTPIGNNPERLNQVKGRIERTYSAEQEAFFGHRKLQPELIVLKDKTKSSRNAAARISELYGSKVVTEIKRKEKRETVIIRRKNDN